MERNHSPILAKHICAQAVCTHTHHTHIITKYYIPLLLSLCFSIQMKGLLDVEAYLLMLRNQSWVHVALSIHTLQPVSQHEGSRGGEGWNTKAEVDIKRECMLKKYQNALARQVRVCVFVCVWVCVCMFVFLMAAEQILDMCVSRPRLPSPFIKGSAKSFEAGDSVISS